MFASLLLLSGAIGDRYGRRRALLAPVAVWAAVAGGSAVLGLIASGLLLEVWHWQSVFGLDVVLAAIAILGTLRVAPESPDPDAPRIDFAGARRLAAARRRRDR